MLSIFALDPTSGEIDLTPILYENDVEDLIQHHFEYK